MADTNRTVLVVGDDRTPASLADLTAFAFDVADRLGLPAQVAVGMQYDVNDYAGIVVDCDWLESAASIVLVTEAQNADMFVIDAATLYTFPTDEKCGHCGEEGDAAPVLVGDTWTSSVHATCAEAHARVASLAYPIAV
ncbi:hypothetical protein [Streptomyces niveus]|uniref:Histidine kinase n=1 Tax=Streptomyces niveus TaxID=193462 RepID=A0ABZ2ABI2_STRNV|nr:hypothetical protein [Streptomyces niveus]